RNSVPEIEVYGECIIGFLQKYFGGAMPNIFIEPGRYFVADAGVIAGEVLLIRDDIDGTGRRWVFLDTGKFNGLQETERTQYRIASSGVGSHLVPVVLAGPTCDSDDIIYEKTPYFLPDNLTLGDKVFFLSAGAYTRTYATVNFNGFVPLKEYYI
ncbi:hypothetical protein KDK77_03215, partial [bacterium]|nr:hypothetical protein [bacterium]